MQTSQLRDGGHNTSAPGFSQTSDPFAILSRKGQADDDDDGCDWFWTDRDKYFHN